MSSKARPGAPPFAVFETWDSTNADTFGVAQRFSAAIESDNDDAASAAEGDFPAGGPHLPNFLEALPTEGCPTSRAFREVGFHGRGQLLGGAAPGSPASPLLARWGGALQRCGREL